MKTESRRGEILMGVARRREERTVDGRRKESVREKLTENWRENVDEGAMEIERERREERGERLKLTLKAAAIISELKTLKKDSGSTPPAPKNSYKNSMKILKIKFLTIKNNLR